MRTWGEYGPWIDANRQAGVSEVSLGPQRSGGLLSWDVWLRVALTDRVGSCLVFAGSQPCSFDPKNLPPSPGLPSAGGIPVAQLLFSKTQPRSHLHGQFGQQGRCEVGRSGTVEVFQGRGTPAGSHIKERWTASWANLSPPVGSSAPPAPKFFL